MFKAINSETYTGQKALNMFNTKKLEELPEDFSPYAKGDLNFPNIKTIPNGFKAKANWNIKIPKVKQLPDDCQFEASGLQAESLVKIPSTWNHKIYAWLTLNSITSIPNNFPYLSDGNMPMLAGGKKISINSVTELPGNFAQKIAKYSGLSVYINSVKILPNGFKYIDSGQGNGANSSWHLGSLETFPQNFQLKITELRVLSSLREEVEEHINSGMLSVNRVLYFKNLKDLTKYKIEDIVSY
jgi:hypothetical protein